MGNMIRKSLTVTVIAALAFSVTVHAGAFDVYYDYQNEDGSYSYYFDQGVTVTMDEEWYRNTFVKISDEGAGFYHKASYDAYEKEGYTGGWLFSIGASVNTDFEDAPSFEYIGFDEEEAMNYYVLFPTDYQAYAEDESIRAEYDSLWEGVHDVVAGIELDSASETAEGGMLAGGWAATEDTALTEEAQAAFDKALEGLVGVDYEPAGLLATQVVAGTNYCFLCRTTQVVPDAVSSYALVYVYEDLEGNAEILGIRDIVFGEGILEEETEISDENIFDE